MMIDEQLLQSAKIIRQDFIKLNSSLENYSSDVKDLSDFLLRKIDDLKSFSDTRIKNIKTHDDINEVSKHLIKEIESIEIEEKKLRIFSFDFSIQSKYF